MCNADGSQGIHYNYLSYYGFDKDLSELIYNYLKTRKQRVKKNNTIFNT